MNGIEIIADYLKKNGFDGLWCPDIPCGCGLDDLAPCRGDGCSIHDCEPAYKRMKKCEDCNQENECYDPDGKEKACYSPKKHDAAQGGK